MDRYKVRKEVLKSVRKAVAGELQGRICNSWGVMVVDGNEKLSNLGFNKDKLGKVASFMEVDFGYPLVDVSVLEPDMPVKALVKFYLKVQQKVEVKDKLRRLIAKHGGYDKSLVLSEKMNLIHDLGYDVADSQALMFDVEKIFDVDLTGCDFSYCTFGEIVDMVWECLDESVYEIA